MNDGYYNTTVGISYIWDGDSWEIFAQDGSDGSAGSDGVSINWLGSLASAPGTPQLNDGYYNTTVGISYIWDGDSWEILTQDGQNATSLNVSGSIAPGNYLSLQHNLGRDDLTFNAQFVKNGYIYDYGDYFSYYRKEKPATVFENAQTTNITTAVLNNGNYAVVYCDDGNTSWGTFAIYDEIGNLIKSPTLFNSYPTYYFSTTTLNNGNFAIAYSDANNSYYGTIVIYDANGNEVVSSTVFANTDARPSSFSTKVLNNGNIIIAYKDGGNSNYGTFVICDTSVVSTLKCRIES